MRHIAIILLALTTITAYGADLKERTRGYFHFRKGATMMMSIDSSLIGNLAVPRGNEDRSESADEYLVGDLSPEQIAGYKQAIAELEKAAVLIPEEADVHAIMAMCYWAVDDLDKAIACYTRAIDTNPARDDIISARMTALLQQGRIEDAERDFRLLETAESEFVEIQRANLEEKKAANQALQTTPITRSVYEKTTEFGRRRRGV